MVALERYIVIFIKYFLLMAFRRSKHVECIVLIKRAESRMG
jgi:hypothetical protein